MQDWGFNFVRVPMAYPFYLEIDRTRNIKTEDVYKISNAAVDRIDNLVLLAHKYDMHVSLNLHRAPGYCVNAGFYEPYNLWTDQEALDAFCFHCMWQALQERFAKEDKL
jgi:aryl-phospho-beta-D-glucosidase BglC (GH1 family)